MAATVVLQTWKEISAYVGRTERTLQRWEREFGFPVHRPSGKSRSSVMALPQEIEDWARGKPSLKAIRRSARLNPSGLHLDARDARDRDHPHRQLSRAQMLQDLTLQELRRAKRLREEQHGLHSDIVQLLERQKQLCQKIMRDREKRNQSGTRVPKAQAVVSD